MKLCECGCGKPVWIATKTWPRFGWVKGQPVRFLRGHQPRGADHYAWKGGRVVGDDGYVYIRIPDHHRAKSNGYVREHLVIAERALGRPLLATHQVHHVDGDRANNAPGNLVICEDGAYHHHLHQRTRALEACGDPSALRCRFCGGYERQEDMHVSARGRTGRLSGYHRSCERAACRRRKQEQQRRSA